MPNNVEYALMAGRAYYDTRADINRFPVPDGWQEPLDKRKVFPSGFEAGYFVRGDEIVISFAGTATDVDWIANSGLATGVGSDQLREAALYYCEVRAANPNAQITFTGHSLGGGLASLLGVFFDRPTFTFDQAPFRLSATTGMRDDLLDYLDRNGFDGTDLQPLRDFTSLNDRAGNVTGLYVQGEALVYLSVLLARIGAQEVIKHGTPDVSLAVDLHSQTLLTAFLQSDAFRQITFKLPDLIRAIFDGSLYKRDTGTGNTRDENFIEHLVRHQAGGIGSVPEGGDAMLDRFALDFQQLADLKPGAADAEIVRILTEIGLQHYYQQDTTNEYVFQALGGGIQFDLTQPLGDLDTPLNSILGYDKLLTWARQQVGGEVADSEEENPLNSLNELLGESRRWNVPVGNSGLSGGMAVGDASDIVIGGGNGDFFDAGGGDDYLTGGAGGDILRGGAGDDRLFGGSGDDRLDGGDDADKLYGGAGKDVLQGGEGDDRLRGGRGAADYLVGGAGDDTYIYTKEDGADLIWDEDGDGHIEYDGTTLNGGRGQGRNSRVFYDNPDAPDYTYSVSGDMNAGPVTLTITRAKGGGQLTVFDFYDGDLGITLTDGDDRPGQPPKAKRPPTPSQTPGSPNRGDPLVIDLAGTGIQTYGLAQHLHFDHDQDAFAENTGWIAQGSGLLVLDADADSVLDDGRELFGDETILPGGQRAINGFQALSQYDRNRDGIIDAQDDIWSRLRVAVWETGPRGEAVLGDPAEAMSLKTLGELGIESISLDSTIATATDANGNTRTRTGHITLADGATRELAEYRFARDNSETRFLDWREVPESIAALPELTLGGVQMDLTQALIRDAEAGWLGNPPGSLRQRLDAWLAETDTEELPARFEDLVYAWTGAEAIAEGTTTNQLDARHARVLEQAYGRSFQNPNAEQAAAWQLTYERLTEGLYASLLAQTHLQPYYDAIEWRYSDVTGRAFGDLSQAQALLDAELAADADNGRALVNEFGRLLRGLGLTRDTTYFALREHFTNGGDPALAFAFDAAGKPVDAPTEGIALNNFTQALRVEGNAILYGNGGDDVLYGGQGSARMVGGPGDNVLFGDAGGESLWGHEGDDVLDGGTGSDQLMGMVGNDVYIFRRGSGVDAVVESSGIDMVFFGGGLTRADIGVGRTADGVIEIRIVGADDVLRLPLPSAYGGTVELFMFGDGSLFHLIDMLAPTEADDFLLGSAGNDSVAALGGNDTVEAGAGNDVLYGNDGNDRLSGEDGNDLLYGNDGNDTLVGGAGDDILDGCAGDDVLAATDEDRKALASWSERAGRGNGNDEYRFGFGDGHDTIIDTDRRSGNVDTIALKAGVTPGDVTLQAVGNDLVLLLSSGDTLRVKGHYGEDGYNAIERILFADGTVWNGGALFAPTVIGTLEGDRLHALSHRSTHVIGLSGNDVLYGGRKDDLLEGGDGNDVLHGQDGDDVLRGGAGDDRLEGRMGSDAYDGGAGSDFLTEPDSTSINSPGADVFLFGRGDGQDTLVSRRIHAYDWWVTPPSQQYGPAVVVDDIVRFKAGVSPDDVTVTGVRTNGVSYNSSADVRIDIAGDPDSSLRIEGFLNGYHDGIIFTSTVKRFEFADGTVWSFEDIANRLVWQGTPGDDTQLYGSWYDDRIFGLGGNDGIAGLWGNDIIDAGDGDDVVYSSNGDDVVIGGSGNDSIYPGEGNDVVDGGAGDDAISLHYSPWLLNWHSKNKVQHEGDLTVLFGHGDGHDVVETTNQRADSDDAIRLKAGVAPEDVKLVRDGDDLMLLLPGSGDTLRVRHWFSAATDAEGNVTNPFRVEGILFEDGTRWGVDEIRAGVLVGTEADDLLMGYAGSDDLIEGRAGDDIMRGETGNDTYVVRNGDGQDTILDSAGADTVCFADRLPGDVRAHRVGDDLILDAGGDRVAISGWFGLATGGVQSVLFSDGSEWDANRLRELVLAGTPAGDVITGYDSNDTLTGMAGADALSGGIGNDAYVYRRGDGRDTIREAGGQDVLVLADLMPGEVSLRSEGLDLVVSVIPEPGEDETDVVRLIEWFYRSTAMVERIVFADGSELEADAIREAVSQVTDSDDYLLGTPGDDMIDGRGGEDTILGFDGDDIIRGGSGNDLLAGGAGVNEYRMGRGDGFDEICTTPSRTSVFPSYMEYIEQELSQLDDLGGLYKSSYWVGQMEGWEFYRIPLDIREPLIGLSNGVPVDVARETLGAMRSWLSGGTDVVVLGAGISAADLSVQYDVKYIGGNSEEMGEESLVMAVGFGQDEGFLMTSEPVLDEGEGGSHYTAALALQSIRFDDGSELTFDQLIAMADGGIIGEQYGGWEGDDEFLRGSVARDSIYAGDGADRVDARAQDDFVDGGWGDDVIFGGSGDDSLDGGGESDVLIGGAGSDELSGGEGLNVYSYNRGDGSDYIVNLPGDLYDVEDVLSFGAGILPEDVTAFIDENGRLILFTGVEGDALVMAWEDETAGYPGNPWTTLTYAQFISPEGEVRIYDLAGLMYEHQADLLSAGWDSPFALFDEADDYDISEEWLSQEGLLGGDAALAYALTGNPFAEPVLLFSDEGNDTISGSIFGDYIDAGDGDNIVDAGGGDDVVVAGSGDDTILGGPGNDSIEAGAGNDRAIGDAGDDYYYFLRGNGSLIIEDLAQPGEGNTLYLDGVSPSDITLSAANGELVLRVAGDGGEIRLSNFSPIDPYASRAVEQYAFSDGTVFSYDELLQQGLILRGTESSEFLVGAGGDDVITGEGGDDLVAGGMGSDTLEGGLGSDTYVFNLGDGEDTLTDRESFFDSNSIHFGPGIDSSQVHLLVEAGDLVLAYGDEGDSIRMPGVRPGDPATGGVPFNLMRFADGSTLPLSDLVARGLEIIGTASEDALNGAIGDDVLYGLEGRDMLAGGPGCDSYYLSQGSGLDVISDVSDETQSNTLILDFPDLQLLDDLAVSLDPAAGTLTIRVVGTGDGAVLNGFDTADPWGSRAIDSIVFAGSGQTFTYAQLLANGIEIVGTPESDVIEGTTGRDIIRGLEGDDLIAGGTGSDIVEGGAGDDAYVFRRGDGVLTIREDTSGTPGNVLVFGEGISVADIRNNLRFVAPDDATGAPGWLRIGIGSSGDEVRIEGFDPDDAEVGAHGVEHFLFDDGTRLGYRDLVLNTFIVQGDETDNALAGSSVQDRLYGYEGNDELRGGAGNDTLTGGTGDDLLIGGSGADMYALNRGDGNDTIVDSAANYDAGLLVFGSGIDANDLALLRDGDDLLISYGEGDSVRMRNWLPDRAGLWSLQTGDGVSQTMAEALNGTPLSAGLLPGQAALEDQLFSFILSEEAFGDPEGGELVFRAELASGRALPSWLAFDPATHTFSGVPENVDVGTLEVVVHAADEHGASVAESLRIEVVNTNDAPEAASVLADRQLVEDETFSFAVAEDAFRDLDVGDTLTLSASMADGSDLPGWITFDGQTRFFSGTPGNDQVGSHAIAVTATDQSGAAVTQTFLLDVGNVNDAPEAGIPLDDRTVRRGEPFTWQIPADAFSDADAGDRLVYAAGLADGAPLPEWLAFDPASGSFSGTPTAAGLSDIRVTATDLAGAAASQVFSLEVTDGDLLPVAAADAGEVTEDRRLFAWGNVLANDSDPEGGSLSVADPGIRRGEYGLLGIMPDGNYAYWLDNFSPGVQGLGAGESVVERFSYLASDGTGRSSGELAITVHGANDAPVLARRLADVQLARGAAFSWQVPAGSFRDRDRNDVLNYSATLANGRPLPGWLKFDAATQTFSGTAPGGGRGGIEVRVVARDGHGECSSAEDVFRIALGSRTILPRGNEGVGNGEDPPPPGHGDNWNDGSGAMPGHPGRRRDEVECDVRAPHAACEDWIAEWGRSRGHRQSDRIDAAAVSRWSDPLRDCGGNAGAHRESDIRQSWIRMERALQHLLAERPAGWDGLGQAAEYGGLGGMVHGGRDAMCREFAPVPPGPGADHGLVRFQGLRDGIQRLGWS